MTTQPSDWAVAPQFGEWLRGIYASERNPYRDGMYVRTIRRTGRCNPGTYFELTDGKGNFWQYPRDSVIRLNRARELDASGGGEPLQSIVAEMREWATGDGCYDESEDGKPLLMVHYAQQPFLKLCDRLQAANRHSEPYAWEARRYPNGLKRYLTQRQYDAQTKATQAHYKPICETCATPRAAEAGNDFRAALEDLHSSLRIAYAGVPSLPIDESTMDAATDALHAFCLLIGIHKVEVGPYDAAMGTVGAGGGE